MLFTFLFLVFFSIYMWLYYKPNRTSSSQYHRYGSADLAATTPLQTTPTARISNVEASPSTAKLQPNEDKPIVQIVDKRTLIPEQSLSVIIAEEKLTVKTESAAIQDTSPKSKFVEAVEDLLPEKRPQAREDALIQASELELDTDMELEPALTEEEAIALAVKTTLARDTVTEVSIGKLEGSVPELMHPKPPDPELVEAAVRDAEEKSEDFSPPEIVDNESQVKVGFKRKNDDNPE